MRILLLGEYSGLHLTLADGLRQLGHHVVVASDGDAWKNYSRDIDLCWHDKYRMLDIVKKMSLALPKMRNFDVVQLINPVFLNLRPERNLEIFKYLKRFNRTVFLGANGDDYFYVKCGLDRRFNVSVFNHRELIELPLLKAHVDNKLSDTYRYVNSEIANSVNGITACCTEYDIAYKIKFGNKLKFIPLPINVQLYPFVNTVSSEGKIRFFLGIQENRKQIKGMDKLYNALVELEKKYPDDVQLMVARNVPFNEYNKMLDSSNVLCDQLYSYGNGMNGVMAMSKGLIVAGGGEEEMYQIFGENENKPIINLPDNEEGVFQVLEDLLARRKEFSELARKSRAFAIKHHDHIKVAQQYVDFWNSKM